MVTVSDLEKRVEELAETAISKVKSHCNGIDIKDDDLTRWCYDIAENWIYNGIHTRDLVLDLGDINVVVTLKVPSLDDVDEPVLDVY